MARAWPWKDNHEAKLKRIAESYRTALMDAAPARCDELDARMIEYGQRWICSDSVIDVDRLVTAREVSEEFGLPPWSVHDWARRHPDQIPKHERGGGVLYRLGDVLAYHSMKGMSSG